MDSEEGMGPKCERAKVKHEGHGNIWEKLSG
jgi:hypothetical protein